MGKQTADEHFVCFGRQEPDGFREVALWRQFGIAHRFPQRTPKERSEKKVVCFVDVLKDDIAAAAVEQKAAVGIIIFIGKDKLRTFCTLAAGYLHVFAV